MRRHLATRAGALVTATILATYILSAAPALARPHCFGKQATIVGTPGPDRLRGTVGADVIVGLGGADILRGLAGDDLLCGGRGWVAGSGGILGAPTGDLLVGGAGHDELHGGAGPDDFLPGPGNDLVRGGRSEFDIVRYVNAKNAIAGGLAGGQVAGMGSDSLLGGVEHIVGSRFDDVIHGNDGFNVLVGMAGDDTLSGLGQFDSLAGGAGDDVLDGGDGIDFVESYVVNPFVSKTSLAGPVKVNLEAGTSTGNGTDSLVGIEEASGSRGDDVMIGNAQDNVFVGLSEGDDEVLGGAGRDTIDGGVGADNLVGGVGIDTLGFLDSPVRVTVNLSTSTDSDGDRFEGFENVVGSIFSDSIIGKSGSNQLEGAEGVDHLFGLGGNDSLHGGYFGFNDAGLDSAHGGLDDDACDAEKEIACETDPPSTVAGYPTFYPWARSKW